MNLQSKSVQIVGPYFTNYSLAQVNRNLALALSSQYRNLNVWLWCPKDRIDYLPTKKEIEQSELKNLISLERKQSDIAIFNNTPRDTDGLYGLSEIPSKIIIPYIAWEESIFPKKLVDEINEYAHLMFVTSKFVYHIMKDSGIRVPIFNISEGIDNDFINAKPEKFELKTKKNFKFFHASTGRARKGVDVLLKAYFKTFDKNDDCVLIIKTFPNPNNMVPNLLKELQNENAPEVEVIDRTDLTPGQMKFLTKNSDCCVYPSRAEGFGLPMAETIYCEVPLITTGYGGVLDFVDENSAFLLDFEVDLAYQSESGNVGARWAEPSVENLSEIMRKIYERKIENINEILASAKRKADEISWANVAERVRNIFELMPNLVKYKKSKHAVISPYNSQDGIAEDTRLLYQSCEKVFKSLLLIANKDIADRVREDDSNVVRLWNMGGSDFDDVMKKIKKEKFDSVHIQYHSGSYYSNEMLDKLLSDLKKLNIKIILELHAVRSEKFDLIKSCKNLSLADSIIVHNKNDQIYMSKKLDNVIFLPLGEKLFYPRSKFKVKKDLGLDKYYPIIATHGLFNKNKNIPLVIEAFSKIKNEFPNAMFLGLNALSDNNIHAQSEYKKSIELAKKLDILDSVVFITDFLEREELEIFARCVDFFVLPYEHVGESASGAVRTCLASGGVVITSDIPQFEDFSKEIIKIKDIDQNLIYEQIIKLINSPQEIKKIREQSYKTLEKISFDSIALEFLSLLQ